MKLRSYSIYVLFLTLVFFPLGAAASEPSAETLLCRLDSMIENSSKFTRIKLDRIEDIKAEGRRARNDEEKYYFNSLLYDEYYVFSADSAMKYVNENLRIARKTGNTDRENEWKIKRSFLLSVMGLLKESEEELNDIEPQLLAKKQLGEYYNQRAYLYSHLDQFTGSRNGGELSYKEMSRMYEDSTYNASSIEDPYYIWHKAQSGLPDKAKRDSLIVDMKRIVDKAKLDSRTDAMNAYMLSRLYEEGGDTDNRIRYLALSGIADVAIANRDIASIEELGKLIMERGDIDRAYRYINYCMQQAVTYPNHIRASSLAQVETEVHRKYIDKLKMSERRQSILIWTLAVAVVLLIIITGYALKRRSRLLQSKKELQESNERLNSNLKELSKARATSEETMTRLKDANVKIRDINEALKEANYVKEECIGATFALSSSYIDKLNDFRKTVRRLVRSNSWNELRELVSGSGMSSDDLKELYSSFDTLFLNIYPDFVKDLNGLLRPEEQIQVKAGELNTELRIYALVRLGISDSVKIAGVLHCSPQTVYNYRLRMRNKAAVPRETFAESVKSLGKFQN